MTGVRSNSGLDGTVEWDKVGDTVPDTAPVGAKQVICKATYPDGKVEWYHNTWSKDPSFGFGIFELDDPLTYFDGNWTIFDNTAWATMINSLDKYQVDLMEEKYADNWEDVMDEPNFGRYIENTTYYPSGKIKTEKVIYEIDVDSESEFYGKDVIYTYKDEGELAAGVEPNEHRGRIESCENLTDGYELIYTYLNPDDATDETVSIIETKVGEVVTLKEWLTCDDTEKPEETWINIGYNGDGTVAWAIFLGNATMEFKWDDDKYGVPAEIAAALNDTALDLDTTQGYYWWNEDETELLSGDDTEADHLSEKFHNMAVFYPNGTTGVLEYSVSNIYYADEDNLINAQTFPAPLSLPLGDISRIEYYNENFNDEGYGRTKKHIDALDPDHWWEFAAYAPDTRTRVVVREFIDGEFNNEIQRSFTPYGSLTWTKTSFDDGLVIDKGADPDAALMHDSDEDGAADIVEWLFHSRLSTHTGGTLGTGVDEDNDGIADDIEAKIYGNGNTSVDMKGNLFFDNDGDGIPDIVERVQLNGLDRDTSGLTDSDRDGIPDELEKRMYGNDGLGEMGAIKVKIDNVDGSTRYYMGGFEFVNGDHIPTRWENAAADPPEAVIMNETYRNEHGVCFTVNDDGTWIMNPYALADLTMDGELPVIDEDYCISSEDYTDYFLSPEIDKVNENITPTDQAVIDALLAAGYSDPYTKIVYDQTTADYLSDVIRYNPPLPDSMLMDRLKEIVAGNEGVTVDEVSLTPQIYPETFENPPYVSFRIDVSIESTGYSENFLMNSTYNEDGTNKSVLYWYDGTSTHLETFNNSDEIGDYYHISNPLDVKNYALPDTIVGLDDNDNYILRFYDDMGIEIKRFGIMANGHISGLLVLKSGYGHEDDTPAKVEVWTGSSELQYSIFEDLIMTNNYDATGVWVSSEVPQLDVGYVAGGQYAASAPPTEDSSASIGGENIEELLSKQAAHVASADEKSEIGGGASMLAEIQDNEVNQN